MPNYKKIIKNNFFFLPLQFFGFAAFITYSADAFFQFRAHRNNSYAQNDAQYGQQYNQRYAPSSGPNPPEQRQQPTYQNEKIQT